MKKLIQGALLPFTIFASVIVMIGCDPSMKDASEHKQTETKQTDSSVPSEVFSDDTLTTQTDKNLKTGNVFYMASDVANMQVKAGDYVSELQKTQQDLQQAVETKNLKELQTTAKTLQQQLTEFNQVLSTLNLKSQEIDQVRLNIMSANKQALASPYLNGEVDLSKIDLNKLEKQINTVQGEMFKLAGMVLSDATNESSDEENFDAKVVGQ